MKYLETPIRLLGNSEKHLKSALNRNTKTVTILLQSDINSKKKLLLTKKQVEKLQIGPAKIKFNSGQILKNRSMRGGFILSLLGALATAVATGLIERAVAGSGVDNNTPITKSGLGLFLKKRRGDGMYLKRNGRHAKITYQKKRIFLTPTKRKIPVKKDGIYLLNGKEIYEPTNEHKKFKILH